MAKLNKLALVRLALQVTMQDLTREEKLRVLADMQCPLRDGVRWWGGNGNGPGALDQGIYNHVTKLRIVGDLWQKLEAVLHANMFEEAKIVRAILLKELSDEDAAEISGQTRPPSSDGMDDEMPDDLTVRRAPQATKPPAAEQMKLAVNSPNPSKYAPPDDTRGGYSL
jgi:hypothetical protein